MFTALSSASRTAVLTGQRRYFASTQAVVQNLRAKHHNRTKNWLSDPATYPLIFILGCAGVFCTGVGITCLRRNPDVCINPTRRGSVMRDWGLEHNK